MKIASIVGARPQFIKCAPVSRELRKEHEEVLIHTGQHYDHGMSEVFFEELAIPKPDYNLNIGSGTHGHQTGAMLGAIEDVLQQENPDLVLVYGDTNSTLAGALAAAKLHVPVAHVEAGLRSFDRRMPEEINRVLTDHCSDLLFCPTETAVENLADEGITGGVHLVGDVMVDAMNYNRSVAEERSGILENVGVRPGEYSSSPSTGRRTPTARRTWSPSSAPSRRRGGRSSSRSIPGRGTISGGMASSRRCRRTSWLPNRSATSTCST